MGVNHLGKKKDHGLETLLALDGDTYVIHEAGYWVKFDVKRVEPAPEWPHGIKYSLTLHGPGNERLVGFDHAHAVRKTSGPSGKHKAAKITGTVSRRFDRISTTMRCS
jgi:hypothetical protein